MLHKSFEALDTKVDAQAGTFEATVAIFNNVDKGGDRIIPGAFKKTLAAWKATGDPIPVIFNHDWGTPDAHVGVVEDAKETSLGLWVKGRLDIDDNPVAKQVHRLMGRRSLKEFSFGYSVPAGGEKRAKDGANDLLEIVLAEVGPTLKGMNPATELHAVKSALEADQGTPGDLRARAAKAAREVEESLIPSVPEQPAKRLASDLRERLDAAGAERFGTGDDRWVYVDDFDPDLGYVIYFVNNAQDRRYIRVQYATDGDQVTLAAEETDVVRSTTYRPKSGDEPDTNFQTLQEVKEQLATVRVELEDLKSSKADEATKGPRARVADPLRQQAEATALEVASGGLRLPPPQTPAPPAAPTLELGELKRRMRDEMLGVLSGGPIA